MNCALPARYGDFCAQLDERVGWRDAAEGGYAAGRGGRWRGVAATARVLGAVLIVEARVVAPCARPGGGWGVRMTATSHSGQGHRGMCFEAPVSGRGRAYA